MKEITSCDEIPDSCKVVVKFYANWCPPCLNLAPAFKILSEKEEYSNILFLEVNVDNAQEIAEKFEISTIPAILFIDQDELVNQCGGNLNMIIEYLDALK